MLANEAVVRGALEADVKVVAFYPGSPTSEILDTFSEVLKHFDDYKMHIAVNEKVALETVAGASMAGMRSLTSMKSVVMNVASDAMLSHAYTGISEGCVCLIADDPHAHSSQSEQDGRYFGEAAYIPMIEPSTAQEAYKMAKWAFAVSEIHRTLVMIRTTTRVNHQRGMVQLGKLNRTPFIKNQWSDFKAPYYTVGPIARALKAKLLEKVESLRIYFEKCEFNHVEEGEGQIGIITAGVCFLHAKEAMNNLGVKLPILKIGTLYPLPEKRITEFLKNLDTVIVIEELSPYLELRITAIAKEANPSIHIVGKKSGDFNEMLEYSVPIVESFSQHFLNNRYRIF
jgi:indolepyruvate ferredoxin oxidoreductase alpha subunit